ncbi:MAG: DUF4402 domain-containing protein [Cetobacterium sp.]|uniref:DUF4402 domain-containing protein n=1 Tax=Cetobacterium sp. TaxID=2071632 RepID=UPI002FC9BA48
MKKLITLLSLTMAMTAFGVTTAPQGNEEKTGDMNISAIIITPLTVRAGEMAFGRVIQGSEATATANFIIAGEKDENITVTIPETVTLTNGENTLNVAIARDIPTNLGTTGTITVPVNGSIVTSSSTTTGTYEGTLTATVRYN